MKFTSKKQKDAVNEAEMTSDEIADFKRRLFAGEVRFKFTKKDGTLREARGTTSPDLLPPPPLERQYDNNALQRARPARVKPANIICFYDLDAQGWRSFDSNRFEGIIEAINEASKGKSTKKLVDYWKDLWSESFDHYCDQDDEDSNTVQLHSKIEDKLDGVDLDNVPANIVKDIVRNCDQMLDDIEYYSDGDATRKSLGASVLKSYK